MPSLQQDQRSTPAPLVSSCDSADPQTLRETNSRREGRRAAALAARPQLKMLLLLQQFPWKNGPGRSCANRGGGEGPLRSAPAPARPRSSAARCQRAVPRCRPGPPPNSHLPRGRPERTIGGHGGAPRGSRAPQRSARLGAGIAAGGGEAPLPRPRRARTPRGGAGNDGGGQSRERRSGGDGRYATVTAVAVPSRVQTAMGSVGGAQRGALGFVCAEALRVSGARGRPDRRRRGDGRAALGGKERRTATGNRAPRRARGRGLIRTGGRGLV